MQTASTGFTNVAFNNIASATTMATNKQYVCCDLIISLIMVDAACAILMFSQSSMLEPCMLIIVLVMNYWLVLIMSLPNFSTIRSPLSSKASDPTLTKVL